MRPEDLVGQILGHYRLLRTAGIGGMSTVFLAQDINLQREVAVKVFWPRPGDTRDFQRRFSREARILAQLDHPNILPIYDYGDSEGHPYLVMPFMARGSLKDLLKVRKVLSPAEAIRITTSMLLALQYAYERNLIHRDIKPGNILFKNDGTPLLSDFGLVKVLSAEGASDSGFSDETASQSSPMLAGTPEYMSPEQINGQASFSSDLYSLGIVLYEMLCGERPFTASTTMSVLLKQVNEQPLPPREINPSISPQLESGVLRALEKDPSKRYQRPIDFLQALTWAGSFDAPNDPLSNPGETTPMSTAVSPAANTSLARPQSREGYDNNTALLGASQARSFVQSSQTPPPATVQSDLREITPITAPPLPKRARRLPLLLLALLLLLLVGVISSLALPPVRQTLFGLHNSATATATTPPVTTATASHSITPVSSVGKNGDITSTPGTGGSSTTSNVPTTSTTCPASGTARAPVVASLKLGQDPNIIYIVNEGPSNAPTFGTIKRYNTVTGTKVEIARMQNTRITEAQVSADGQWTLFTAIVSGQYEMRMVRMDGQGLQTLLCAPAGYAISGTQWSLNQQDVVFDEGQGIGSPIVYLLDMTNGALQKELVPTSASLAYTPRTWLDRTHILMTGFVPNSDAPAQNIYLLDTTKGANQADSSLQQVATLSQQCWDFDSNGDSTQLYVSKCVPGQPHGSGSVSSQPASGGTLTPYFTSSTLAIQNVRTIDLQSTNLLLLVANVGLGVSGDSSQDGLWKVKTDGTGLTRLTTTNTSAGESSMLNQYSQYIWSNISRNGTLFALETVNSSSNTYTLLFGSLNGGSTTTFASISGAELEIAGWTTL